MNFLRVRIAPQPAEVLRALGSRHGWLIESPDTLRVGFGDVVQRLPLPDGLAGDDAVMASLRSHSLSGDDGPMGSGIVAFASLPFDRDQPGELVVARFLICQRGDEAWLTSAGGGDAMGYLDATESALQETQDLCSFTYKPSPDEYAHHVAQAVELLRNKELDKVVLARAVVGSVDEPIDPASLAQRLRRREPACTIYGLPTSDGRRYVGASPELLVRRSGDTVTCHPLAGTIKLPPGAATDDYHKWLLGSTKNLREHALLVDDMVTTLADHFHTIEADASPSIVTLRTVAHLGTWIRGRSDSSSSSPDAVALLRILHPTAAVGGLPRDRAYQVLLRLESHDRGHYAGPVGWVDHEGDGEWWVGIRGVLLDGNNFEVWAGAGIVSESDPIAEREETRDKMASVLSALVVDRL